MSRPLRIGDLVEVPEVRTVVRLEEGRTAAGEIASSFVFTPEIVSHVAVIAEALMAGRGQGYFLQGDFGSGKSHFLAALYAWLAGGEAGAGLSAHHAGLARLAGGGRRYLPVDISLVNYRSSTPLETIVVEAVERGLGRARGQPVAAAAGDRLALFEGLLASVREAGYAGLVLLIDELSEFLRSKPDPQALNEDARTLQLLGELAGREPLWIVAAVQESIEATGDLSQAILRKIKDRYPVKLALSTLHVRALIAGRLVRRRPGAEAEIARIHERFSREFPSFTVPLEQLLATYPVHPETLALLDGLGDLFSQHRGIVDFVHSRIAGDPRRGIAGILERPASELLGPDAIYEHFSQRLAEFSSFHRYPRHIVPHLDETIERVIGSEDDRALARRLVRILVLYRIHPTAPQPDVSRLAELASCSLQAPSPSLNARFVSEAILDPVARESRFLSRSLPASGDPLHAVYAIATEEDPGKLLEARVRACLEEIAPDDARLLIEPLAQLPESESWPGEAVWGDGATRLVTWNGSSRRVLVRFLHGEDPRAFADRLAYDAAEQRFDCAVALALEEQVKAEGYGGLSAHAALWLIPKPAKTGVLRDYLATRIAASRLAPASPADLPLAPLAKERLARLAPAAAQAALEALYAGAFSDGRIRLDAAARQLRRFEGLLAAAAEALLAARYPRFAEVAPRGLFPSPRLYQQLLAEFVTPGSLSLTEAQSRGLSAAIESLARPLGLVEVRRNSYLFSPDVGGYPLLAFVFSLIRTAEPTPAPDVIAALRGGPFGLPQDTAVFLVAALAIGGLLTAMRGGRAIPLAYLSLQTVEKADELRLGELIAEGERATLAECTFISAAAPAESFGLKQQREAWKEVVRFKETGRELCEGVRRALSRISQYSSFRAFKLEEVERRLAAVEVLVDSIAVSLPAKEGLERFLAAWRGTGLSGEDVQYLKRLARFLSEKAEELVFVSHYVGHPAVEKAAGRDPEIARLRDSVLALLESPEVSIVADHGAHLAAVFAAFREAYAGRYAAAHGRYYQALERPALSRSGQRALALLQSLAGVEALDRPAGLDRFLGEMAAGEGRQCRRNLGEELLRSPLCGCGFVPEDSPVPEAAEKPEERIEGFLRGYVEILAAARVKEALAARAFALKDAAPATSRRLARLAEAVEGGGLSPGRLPGLLDAQAVAELGRALAGRIPIHRRPLADLAGRLAGRRLPPQRLQAIVSDWLGGARENELVAVEGEAGADAARPAAGGRTALWPLAHAELLGREAGSLSPTAEEARAWERELEAAFPAERVAEALRGRDPREALAFIRSERLHTSAVRAAWLLFAEQVLGGKAEARAGAAPVACAHADPGIAAEIAARLEALAALAGRRRRPLPERLAARLPAERLLADSWSTEELKSALHALLAEIGRGAEPWLAGLPAVEPLSLDDAAVVIIADGASPDVWIEALAAVPLPEGASSGWFRLEAAATTHDSLGRLFGVTGDPQEGLDARGITLVSLRGTEERSLKERLLPLAPGPALVARLSILDREAHRQTLRLSEMAAILAEILRRDLPPLVAACAEAGRRLVLTADHGLSLTRDGLGHGGGGAWERAIFRAEWRASR